MKHGCFSSLISMYREPKQCGKDTHYQGISYDKLLGWTTGDHWRRRGDVRALRVSHVQGEAELWLCVVCSSCTTATTGRTHRATTKLNQHFEITSTVSIRVKFRSWIWELRETETETVCECGHVSINHIVCRYCLLSCVFHSSKMEINCFLYLQPVSVLICSWIYLTPQLVTH